MCMWKCGTSCSVPWLARMYDSPCRPRRGPRAILETASMNEAIRSPDALAPKIVARHVGALRDHEPCHPGCGLMCGKPASALPSYAFLPRNLDAQVLAKMLFGSIRPSHAHPLVVPAVPGIALPPFELAHTRPAPTRHRPQYQNRGTAGTALGDRAGRAIPAPGSMDQLDRASPTFGQFRRALPNSFAVDDGAIRPLRDCDHEYRDPELPSSCRSPRRHPPPPNPHKGVRGGHESDTL